MGRWVPARGVALLCAVGGLLLAGCSTTATSGSSVTVSGTTLDVYASQPPGPASQAVSDTLDAEQLALSAQGGRVGKYTVKLTVLHGRELSDNARSAVQDTHAIAYLGELQPGTSQIATEILNQQDLLVVSPADTAVYLTQPIAPVSNTVSTFYPSSSSYKQTFARVVPNSGQEAKALVQEMQSRHVRSVYATSDGTQYGAALALEVQRQAKSAGLSVAASPSGASAFFYAASDDSPHARALAQHALDVEAASDPSAQLYAPSGLYDADVVSGLSAAAQARLTVSSPGFVSKTAPSGARSFAAKFSRRYGHAPAVQAIFGYEAMSALLAVLAEAGKNAGNRAIVTSDFRNMKRTSSVIGSYTISGGDPSIAPFVFARVRDAQLVPFKFLSLAG
jgi:branched-chain amino acid transport system substrate-binding protein